MPRMYVLNSWVGAAEYDEGDTYNGEQVGNRNQKSVGVHITRSGDQWHANTAAYAEPEKKPTAKKKVDAFSSIMLADKNYTRLANLSKALDEQFNDGMGDLSLEDWAAARNNIDKRLAAAWLRVCKERNWAENGESFSNALDNTNESGLHFSLEGIDTPQKPLKRPFKRELTGWATIDSLSEDNCFKGLFWHVKRAMMVVSKVVTATKTI